jgi:hypothetical protein
MWPAGKDGGRRVAEPLSEHGVGRRVDQTIRRPAEGQDAGGVMPRRSRSQRAVIAGSSLGRARRVVRECVDEYRDELDASCARWAACRPSLLGLFPMRPSLRF